MLRIGLEEVSLDEIRTVLGNLEKLDKHPAVRAGLRSAAQVFHRGMVQRLRARLNPDSKHKGRGRLLAAAAIRLDRRRSIAVAGFRRKPGVANAQGFHSHLVDRGTTLRRTRKGLNRGIMPANRYWLDTREEDSLQAVEAMMKGLQEAYTKITYGR